MKYFTITAKILLTISGCFFILAFFTLRSCHYSNMPCGGADDTIRYGDSISHEGVTYYLYFRTTGFQDKIVYFEVYDGEPVFDACEQTDQKPFFWGDYDDFPKVQYVKDFVLRPNGDTQDESIAITYTDDKTEGFWDVYDVKFTGIEE